MTFCYCGRALKEGKCPRHKDKITKELKEKQTKYSGYSKYRDKHKMFQAREGR